MMDDDLCVWSNVLTRIRISWHVCPGDDIFFFLILFVFSSLFLKQVFRETLSIGKKIRISQQSLSGRAGRNLGFSSLANKSRSDDLELIGCCFIIYPLTFLENTSYLKFYWLFITSYHLRHNSYCHLPPPLLPWHYSDVYPNMIDRIRTDFFFSLLFHARSLQTLFVCSRTLFSNRNKPGGADLPCRIPMQTWLFFFFFCFLVPSQAVHSREYRPSTVGCVSPTRDHSLVPG